MYVLSPYCGKSTVENVHSQMDCNLCRRKPLGKLSALEKVYIRGNVTCNTMTNRETLYNMCELDTRWGAHGDHDSIRLPPADGKKLLTTRCGPDAFSNLYSFSR